MDSWSDGAENLHPDPLYATPGIQPVPHDMLHAHPTHRVYLTQAEPCLPHPYVSTDAPSSESVLRPYPELPHQRFPHQTGGTDGNGLFAVFHNGTWVRYTKHEASHHAAGYAPAWHVHNLPFLQDVVSKTQVDYPCRGRYTSLFQRYRLHHRSNV